MNLIHLKGKEGKTGLSRYTRHAVSLLGLALCSCSMVDEDLEPCAPAPNVITNVNFIYDYNMRYTDLFTQHVGSVYLYVFDENGTYLYRRTRHRADMGSVIDFSIPFDTTEIKPGHTYQMVAIAQGNRVGYGASLETPGFQLQTEMVPGVSKIEDYIIKLDRDNDGTYDFGIVDYKDTYGNNTSMIDTLWSTKPDEVQVVRIPTLVYTPSVEKQPDQVVDVTIPMMRITNSVKVNLVSSGFSGATNPDDYTMLVHFPNGNGTIDFTGTVYPAQELYYRTLRKNLTPYIPGDQRYDPVTSPGTRADAQYAIEAQFGVSRLQMNDESSLQIRDAKTGEMIVAIPDFSKFLADAFSGEDLDGQEFLDREYNYEIAIGLKELPPSSPDNPSNPDNPSKPDNPSIPDNPSTPDNPGGDEPGTEEPGPEEPGPEEPGPEEPGPDEPGPEEPGPDEPGPEEPGPDEPGIEDPEDNWLWIDVYIEALDWYVRINNIKF